jgi:3-methyladenine DNA glycosylase/8-oxoguanine DNA glycosylase
VATQALQVVRYGFRVVDGQRLGRAVAMVDPPPSAEELERLARGCRPYRTWVSLHLRARLEDETEEIGR